ncbi:hypothetical protein C8A00DRAFT_47139 [Chaetomidium leptoderma]|uniref:Uncharacterized protein n=1 Tax=Chaetomidium leptoderma TaxID=669021 RepID=A0AAN6ZU99_9PEZI|nr:hypothetical protein C8A00DRAFT_47139 [Chaetomidium leptoderma]
MHRPHRKEEATATPQSLEKHKLKQWGFHAREHFEVRGMPEVYQKAVWTVIEDPATPDGAGIAETSKRFCEWVWGDEGRQEQEGRSVLTGTWVYCPRYFFYLHVDEESLESVVDEEKAGKADGNCLKAVRADIVLTREERRRADGEEEDEEDENELLDLRKKVKIDEIVELYAALLSIDRWYNILTEDKVCQI